MLSPRHIRNVARNVTQPANNNASHTPAIRPVVGDYPAGSGASPQSAALKESVREMLVRSIQLIDSANGDDNQSLWIQLSDQVNQASAQLSSARLRSTASSTAPPSNAPTNPNNCFLCSPDKQKVYRDRNTLVRHFRETHNVRFRYRCRCCPFHTTRRDRIQTHMEKRHKQQPTRSAIDKTKEEYVCPKDCGTCRNGHNRWEHLESCYVNYCHELWSRRQTQEPVRESIDRRNAGAHDHTLHDVDPGRRPALPNGHRPAMPPGLSASFPAPTDHTARPPAMPHSSSDGIADMHPAHMEDTSPLDRLLGEGHVGLNGLPLENQTQDPHGGLDEPQCRACGHVFSKCDSCFNTPTSTPYCHLCPGASATGVAQQQPMELYDAAYQPGQNEPSVQPNSPTDPNDLTRYFMDDLLQRGGSFYRIGFVRDASTTYLHELDDPKIQEGASPSALLPGLIKQLGELTLSPTSGMSGSTRRRAYEPLLLILSRI